MPEDQETPKPRPPGSESRGPGRPPTPEPRPPDPKPDPLHKAGDRFGELSRDLIDAVNTSGGFEPDGPNAALRPVIRATAENFAAGAAAFSEITRMGIDGGHLTEEDLDLIAEIETWAAHFRMVTLTIQRALGDPPGQARVDRPREPQVEVEGGPEPVSDPGGR